MIIIALAQARIFTHGFIANPCIVFLSEFKWINGIIANPNFDMLIKGIEQQHLKFLYLLKKLPQIENPRVLGTILAFEVKNEQNSSYFNNIRDLLYNKFIENGILLRPLGNTVYIMPPYIITKKQLKKVYNIIQEVLSNL